MHTDIGQGSLSCHGNTPLARGPSPEDAAGRLFAGLDRKLGCVSGDSADCTHLQQFIGPTMLPAYSPILLWLGVVVTILGLFFSRWNKA